MRDDAALATDLRALDDRLERCRGAVELRFDRGGAGATRLARLYQQTPCRALFPHAEPGEPMTAVLLTTSGGLTGGDHLRIAVEAGAGSAAVVTTQAAEKIYRALDRDTRIEVKLAGESESWLEWLPQETILFSGARLRRETRVDLASGARFLGCEIAVFGRGARGERFDRGFLHDGWRLGRRGRLAWADALHLEGDIEAAIADPAGFDGAGACATVVYAGDDVGRHIGRARELLAGCGGRAGATVVNGVLLARFLAPEAAEVRRDVMSYCTGLRTAVAGLPGRLPRVWLT